MLKTSDYLRKTFYIVFIALFSILFFNVIFNNMHFDYKWYIVLPIAAVWSLIICFIGVKIYKYKDILQQKEKLFLFIFFLTLAITQVFFYSQMASYPTRDLENVFRSAYYYAIQGHVDPLNTDYLYKHPNNLTWVISFQFIFRIARKFGADAYVTYILLASAINGMAIAAAYMFTYLCCKRMMGIHQGFFALILMYTCLPLQFNISFFYTDTLTMVFIPFTLYFYITYFRKISKKTVAPLLLYALITAFGIHLKYSVVIVVAAVIIDLFLQLDIKRLSVFVSALLMAFILWKTALDGFTYSHILDKSLAEDAATPFSSYIMMGLNGDGSFNVEDRYFAWRFDTKEEKEENIRRQIKIRLEQHTPLTMIKHLNQKGVRSFGSGNMEYNYTISNAPMQQNILVECVSPGTDEFVFMGNIVQGWHIMLFIFVIISGILSLKNKDLVLFVPLLSIFGLYLFLLLWESSQRYLINYMCMYIIVAVYTVFSFINSKYKHIKTR